MMIKYKILMAYLNDHILSILQYQQNIRISMTEVIEQIELINIISFEQTRLQKNFRLLLQRLNKQNQLIQAFQNNYKAFQQDTVSSFKQTQSRQLKTEQYLTQVVQSFNNRIKQLQDFKMNANEQFISNQIIVDKLKNQFTLNKATFQGNFSILKEELLLLDNRMQLTELKTLKLSQELLNKENIFESEKLQKELSILNEKYIKIEQEIKFNIHKVQKFEILNEKFERNKQKRESEFMKEVEEKVKFQIQNGLKLTENANSLIQGIGFNNRRSINTNPNLFQLSKQQKFIQNSQKYQEPKKIQTNIIEQIEFPQNNDLNANMPIMSSHIFHMQTDDIRLRGLIETILQSSMNKVNQKIKTIQQQNKNLNEILKQIKQSIKKDRCNPQTIKQKINQLRPQIIKIWAKFDTIEDKVIYNEKRNQQKNKIVNELMTLQKQNNWNKVQDKIKNLQTELVTNIKQIKSKIQFKVNTMDYDKYCQSIQEKIKQIYEAISLKSDKMQVKKALLFLEAKIKQIILVISQDQQNEKDALLTKKQVKCISCDKQIQKFSGTISGSKGNWDSLPWKDHPPQMLGRFGMTNYGSLSRKIKRLDKDDLPILKKKSHLVQNTNSVHIN